MADIRIIDSNNNSNHPETDSPHKVAAEDTLRDIPNNNNNNAMEVVLSDYEKLRLDNIRRNNARLRSLGLLSALEEDRSNRLAMATEMGVRASMPTVWNTKHRDRHATKSKRKRTEGSAKEERRGTSTKPPVDGSRKSRRLQGIAAANTDPITHSALEEDDDNTGNNDDDKDRQWKNERKSIVEECREVRLRVANAVAEFGGEAAAKANPTATYDHCLMRVKSMTDKALANRVRVIERAAGTHCVVKMAIFKCCLQDEEKWELASVASDALERLKALKPVPTE